VSVLPPAAAVRPCLTRAGRGARRSPVLGLRSLKLGSDVGDAPPRRAWAHSVTRGPPCTGGPGVSRTPGPLSSFRRDWNPARTSAASRRRVAASIAWRRSWRSSAVMGGSSGSGRARAAARPRARARTSRTPGRAGPRRGEEGEPALDFVADRQRRETQRARRREAQQLGIGEASRTSSSELRTGGDPESGWLRAVRQGVRRRRGSPVSSAPPQHRPVSAGFHRQRSDPFRPCRKDRHGQEVHTPSAREP
jgi:hypothetical protein